MAVLMETTLAPPWPRAVVRLRRGASPQGSPAVCLRGTPGHRLRLRLSFQEPSGGLRPLFRHSLAQHP
eukprot:5409935-Alexandrium_andersonii.AAC.1